MSNWRTMEAGMELDREIALRLGWTIKLYPGYTAMLNPHGEIVGRGFHDAPDGYMWSQAHEFLNMPHYSTDANAALTLLEGLFWSVFGTPDQDRKTTIYRCALNSVYRDAFTAITETADAPALAICRAWLTWKELHS